MALIQWTEDMSVGVESLDADHKRLVGLVNQLDDAVRAGGEHTLVSRVLDALLDYTAVHFEREEALMAASEYPDLETHAQTHRILRTQVIHIRDRHVGNPDAIDGREVLAFLKHWLTSHIMGRDKLYAPFLASRRDRVDAADRSFAESVAVD